MVNFHVAMTEVEVPERDNWINDSVYSFIYKMKRRTVQLARKNSNVFAQFDQKQITELKEAFSFIDQNGDGVVDREDLKEVWTSLGITG